MIVIQKCHPNLSIKMQTILSVIANQIAKIISEKSLPQGILLCSLRLMLVALFDRVNNWVNNSPYQIEPPT